MADLVNPNPDEICFRKGIKLLSITTSLLFCLTALLIFPFIFNVTNDFSIDLKSSVADVKEESTIWVVCFGATLCLSVVVPVFIAHIWHSNLGIRECTQNKVRIPFKSIVSSGILFFLVLTIATLASFYINHIPLFESSYLFCLFVLLSGGVCKDLLVLILSRFDLDDLQKSILLHRVSVYFTIIHIALSLVARCYFRGLSSFKFQEFDLTQYEKEFHLTIREAVFFIWGATFTLKSFRLALEGLATIILRKVESHPINDQQQSTSSMVHTLDQSSHSHNQGKFILKTPKITNELALESDQPNSFSKSGSRSLNQVLSSKLSENRRDKHPFPILLLASDPEFLHAYLNQDQTEKVWFILMVLFGYSIVFGWATPMIHFFSTLCIIVEYLFHKLRKRLFLSPDLSSSLIPIQAHQMIKILPLLSIIVASLLIVKKGEYYIYFPVSMLLAWNISLLMCKIRSRQSSPV